jgi:hypothetical protein
MVDNSDYIPANAIRFGEAFERLFDAIDPNAGELRAEINCLIETETSGPEYDDAVDKFDVARRDVDLFFRNELRMALWMPVSVTRIPGRRCGFQQKTGRTLRSCQERI